MSAVICNKRGICFNSKTCIHGGLHYARLVTYNGEPCTKSCMCRGYLDCKCVEVDIYGKSVNTGEAKYRCK